MIKHILFDFDGVIHDSNTVKTDGFRSIFNKYPSDLVKILVDYHEVNGGISRYSKIRYFFEKILKTDISEEKVLEFADKFSKIMISKLVDPVYLIKETVDFIKKNFTSYDMHIVSGADEKELQFLCEKLELTEYFKTISGSPIEKNENTMKVMKINGYSAKETVFIGDSINDYYAAEASDLWFIGYNRPDLRKVSYYMDSFQDFDVIINNMRK